MQNHLDIWEALKTLSPFIVIGISGGFLWGIIQAAKFWGAAEEKLNSVNTLNANIQSIQESISEIKGRLNLLQPQNKDRFTQSQSPINLTEEGKRLVEELKIEDSIASKWEEIKAAIMKDNKNKNPYDVQEFLFSMALTAPEKLVDQDGLSRIKKRAYDEGVPLASLSRVVAIVARNKYLKEENIPEEDIDRHDPAKQEV